MVDDYQKQKIVLSWMDGDEQVNRVLYDGIANYMEERIVEPPPEETRRKILDLMTEIDKILTSNGGWKVYNKEYLDTLPLHKRAEIEDVLDLSFNRLTMQYLNHRFLRRRMKMQEILKKMVMEEYDEGPAEYVRKIKEEGWTINYEGVIQMIQEILFDKDTEGDEDDE